MSSSESSIQTPLPQASSAQVASAKLFTRWRVMWISILILGLLVGIRLNGRDLLPSGAYGQTADGTPQLNIACGVTPRDLEICRSLVDGFVESYPTPIEVIVHDVLDDPKLYAAMLGVLLETGSPDLDVMMVEPSQLGQLGPHLQNLNQQAAELTTGMFTELVRAGQFGNRQVAIPYAPELGVLYYRQDLLDKYGYLSAPMSWQELEALAFEIQRGERASGLPDFWGYVWQGARQADLIDNLLEWFVAQGAPLLAAETNTVDLSSGDAARALSYAQRWIGGVSPEAVLDYDEAAAVDAWLTGQVAFLRAGTGALSRIQQSPLRDVVGVARLPSGRSRSVASLSGWYLAVHETTNYPDEATALIAFMTQAAFDTWRAEVGYLPVHEISYESPEILAQHPYYRLVPTTLDAIVNPPINRLGRDYAAVSNALIQGVHSIIADKNMRPELALEALEAHINSLY
ncbi:MAG: extracellular solute-binding protein [Deinococcota bacterium]